MAVGKATFEEVARCQRCWRLFPVSQLQKQEGRLRCRVSCVDDLSNTRRQKLIAAKLASGKEGVSDKPEMFSHPGEVAFE